MTGDDGTDDPGGTAGPEGTTAADAGETDAVDPDAIGSDGPPVAEKPYEILFDANGCIGAGRCAEFSDNWGLDVSTGIARPKSYFVDEEDLEANVRAAEACPARNGRGVIHVIDRRTGEEVAPDPSGDGTVSVDW